MLGYAPLRGVQNDLVMPGKMGLDRSETLLVLSLGYRGSRNLDVAGVVS